MEKPDNVDYLVKDFHIQQQPTDETCGPTCLQALYKSFDDKIKLDRVIDEVQMLPKGGTLAVFMGIHALKRGYKARLYTYNMHVFDPTWFGNTSKHLIEKLKAQMRYKTSQKLRIASKGYIQFLNLGGEIILEDLTIPLIQKYMQKKVPILTGLNSTYLYRSKREIDGKDDDIKGLSAGHFVVIFGYDKKQRKAYIADPYMPKELDRKKYYLVNLNRLISSIMLGVLSYDANMLVIEKKEKKRHR
ncbi:peptidase-C39 like family protein [Candidatus Woesearchaeota archaeon CG11_big_fil_rev_8_21_14_0_20_43_8]|nr:MAG: peptidase-C39 like family protein [Candidatus Woesearchaeota archaeon CG11_big_fil_rev_8_21_14_0_20_43_8]PIO06932.1 MAG: peptidase-C39 like family protein [Candidatus Woesearchaeota archaeon CG08_land_8_20_14_0_20_43_7]